VLFCNGTLTSADASFASAEGCPASTWIDGAVLNQAARRMIFFPPEFCRRRDPDHLWVPCVGDRLSKLPPRGSPSGVDPNRHLLADVISRYVPSIYHEGYAATLARRTSDGRASGSGVGETETRARPRGVRCPLDRVHAGRAYPIAASAARVCCTAGRCIIRSWWAVKAGNVARSAPTEPRKRQNRRKRWISAIE
jgi:hypothetical protein